MSATDFLKGREDSAKAELKRKQDELVAQRGIAMALDGAMTGKRMPPVEFIHVYKLYGSEGSIKFGPQLVDDALQLLADLPPIPRYIVRARSGTSYRPLLEKDSDEERSSARIGDGVELKIHYSESPELEWWTQLPTGELLRIDVRLAGLAGLGPRRRARIDYAPGSGVITKISNADIVMPHEPAGELMRYGAGSPEHWPMMFRWWPNGRGSFIEWMTALRDKLVERGAGLRSAYEADRALFMAKSYGSLNPEPVREPAYAERTLRAGTERQTAELESHDARAEWALVKRHPEMAKADRDIFPDGASEWRHGADHFDWAKARLKRAGLLVDNGYSYGSGWL